MLLFGHPYIAYLPFYEVANDEEIANTPPNSTLFLSFTQSTLPLIQKIQKQKLPLALSVNSVSEVVFAHQLGAKYIIVSKNLSKTAQEIAENYLFDTKILCLITDEDALEEKILEGVDGVIYDRAIIKKPL